MNDRTAVSKWWRRQPLKTKIRWLIAQDLLLALCCAAIGVVAWRSPRIAVSIVAVWALGAVFSTAWKVVERWRALRSPLFFLAAAKHDLGGRDDNAE
jgi:hypothetical protein